MNIHPRPDRRRALVALGACCMGASAGLAAATDDAAAIAAMREGGVVVVMRHALAPGTFDPPGFTLGDCRTQRNLDDVGRAQARRIGAWFRAQGLAPATVRSSQWCRCRDTARLAFGSAVDWPALNSHIGSGGPDAAAADALRGGLAKLPSGAFEVWVTHQVNISHLAGEATAPGEAIVLRPAEGGTGVRVLARLRID